jgi:hypothetical protein
MTNWIDFELDEAQVFRIRDRNGRMTRNRRDISVTARAVIKYQGPGDWFLDELLIPSWNGEMGKDCESWDGQIFASDPLWTAINEYLIDWARDDVELAIVRDMQARHDEQREAAE